MANERAGLLAVDTALVFETLVEKVVALVEQRRAETPAGGLPAMLEAETQPLAGENDPALERGLRQAGYLARVIETELFEPARHPAEWIPSMLGERLATAGSWAQAVADTCGDLARAEPLDKPSPDDEAAMSWRIPGPGGHVRHYVARRTIGEHVRRDAGRPLVGDPAELKRPWLYGFFVRACEEALPPEALLDPEG